MKILKFGEKRAAFKPLAATEAVQAAVMTLAPGESTGQLQNEHPKAEQWLFVVSGAGKAIVGKRRIKLVAESLLLIERNEVHQIENDGDTSLVTVNFYAPPAYRQDGEVLKSVQ